MTTLRVDDGRDADDVPDLRKRLHGSLERGQRHLFDRQAPAGWWKGELRTNVTMDAEDLLLRQFLDILDPVDLECSARWIRSQQRTDATWATFEGGPGDLSTTIEAYVALKLAGDDIDAPHMTRAREFIVAGGGIEASRVFTRIWLALFGEWSWDALPSMPPELILLPSWAPLNVYDWACWARQTVVPITVVATLRPVRPLPFDLDELHTARAVHLADTGLIGHAFRAADRLLKVYDHLPVQPGRRFAMRKAAQWIIERQESDGGWGGIQPPWVYSILALHLLGYADDHPVVSAAIAGLEGFLVREDGPDGPVRRLEACQSPVWDACLAVTALLDSGVEPTHPVLERAGQWLLDEEVRVRGDWAVRRPGLEPGGWAFEFANDYYPDVDDTAEVVLALRRLAGASGLPGADAALRRGIDWVIGMQCADGGWAAFDADNTRRLAEKLPFSDFGAVIDPPSADVTAHVVEMLAHTGHLGERPIERGVRWLLDAQEADGSWFGRWGTNFVYGTGAAVPALVAAGLSPGDERIARAVGWLESHQNADGGWGEDLRSYSDENWIGRGESTASQTAWALLALIAVDPGRGSARRGVRWLLDTQLADGGWDEPLFTGTGFPGDFYINYEMYRVVFPLSALGRYLDAIDASFPPSGEDDELVGGRRDA